MTPRIAGITAGVVLSASLLAACNASNGIDRGVVTTACGNDARYITSTEAGWEAFTETGTCIIERDDQGVVTVTHHDYDGTRKDSRKHP